MSRSKKQVKAFTLLEITLAMLIAAVCMGIGFYVLSTFSRIGIEQQRHRQQDYLRQLFYQRMQKEALAAQRISFVDNSLIMMSSSGETRYTLLDSALVRSQQDIVTDTLFGQIQRLQVQYVPELPQELVSSLLFELHSEAAVYPFVLQKQYSAAQLIYLPEND